MTVAPPPPTSRRILLVDDDPNFFAELRHLLHDETDRWELTYAMSSADARSQLEISSFEVLLADVRTMGRDATSLLELARTHAPGMARLVLASPGHAASVMAAPLAHQVLAKPCEPEIFRQAVARAFRVQELLTDQRVRSLVSGLGALPAQPKVFAELSRVLADPNVRPAVVAATVEADVAISAKVLQLVNSSFFGLGRHLTDLGQAVAYLGLSVLQVIVLSAEVSKMASAAPSIPGFNTETLHAHGEATGIIARGLATGDDSADAFAAGLLQDIGQLVLSYVCPREFAQAVATAQGDGVPLQEAERAQWGFSHAEVGAFLLGLWGLPTSVVEAVAHHHDAPSLEHTRCETADAVYLARARIQAESDLSGDPFDGTPVCDPLWLARIGFPGPIVPTPTQ
jgi:HD-like signal output (HDOD) protein/CheY-like chemotaxis protein